MIRPHWREWFTAIILILMSCVEVSAINLPVRTFEEGKIPKVGKVFGMLQDDQGLIWIWGSRGITIYDGSSFRHLGLDDGLPSEYIYTLNVIASGDILITSYGGLSKYHPESRKVEPILALKPDEPVRDVALHPEGYVLATDSGIMIRYKGILHLLPTMSPYRQGNANCMVTRVDYDAKRDIVWAASDRFGLIRLDMEKVYPLLELKHDTTTSTDPLVDTTVFSYTPYRMLDASEFKIDDPATRYQMWMDAYQLIVPKGNLVPGEIGVWTSEGVIFDEGHDCPIVWDNTNSYFYRDGELQPMVPGLKSGAMHMVSQQWDGSISLTRTDGLYRITDDGIIHIGETSGLLSNNLVAHLHDRQGHDWVVDHHGDLHRLMNEGIEVYSGLDIDGLRDLRKIIVEEDGFLIASAHHLHRLRGGDLQKVNIPGKLGDEIIDVAVGPGGEIFIATSTQVFRINKVRNRLEPVIPGKGPAHVGRMVFGSSGDDIWAVFRGSLFAWNGERMTKHSAFRYFNPLFLDVQPGGLVHVGLWATLTSISPDFTRIYLNTVVFENPLEDAVSQRPKSEREVLYPKGKMLDEMAAICGAYGPDGAYYVGTFNAGIVRIIERADVVETIDRMRVFDVRTGLPSNMVNSMSIARDGTLYFVLGKGAVRVDETGLHNLELPLPDDATLMDLTSDDEGRLYYGTSLGLYMQSGERLYRFDRNQGLSETSVSKVVVLDDGRVLAQQQNGFYLLDPTVFDSLEFEPVLPLLTDLHTNKTPLVFEDRIVLPAGERTIYATLALPEFFNESLHQYSWRLLPLEKEWQPWSSRNMLTYTHLRPGEYKLEYKARNGIEPIDREGAPIELVIPPKLHETGLSLAALIMISALVLMFIVIQVIRRSQAKQRRELEMEMEKLRVAMQLASTVAHEFNNPLQVLQGAYYMLQREDISSEERQRYLDLIPQYTTRMNELIQRLLGLNRLREVDYASGMKILNLGDLETEEAGTEQDSTPAWEHQDSGVDFTLKRDPE